ncbi:MAG: YcaQ family DNA glycosylase [Acetobacteraceae bacterium]|nr:YcaQ family DNA glycosylase [Acetobacteraceae bacterium]
MRRRQGSLESIDLATARRIAVAASGPARPRREDRASKRRIRREVTRLGVLQIDSVSALVRAHYIPLFSRLGPYPIEVLNEAAWGRQRWLFEYWAHQASLVPLTMQPLFRWRMQRAAAGRGPYADLVKFATENRAYVAEVEREIRARGPTLVSDLPGAGGRGGWWGWSKPKHAVEWLFWTGAVSVATRRGFERVYDVTDRVIPGQILSLPTPSLAESQRALLRVAAGVLGIATAGDLADYYRLALREASPRIAELVEQGELISAQVQGWTEPAFVQAGARWPQRLSGHALLTPFDPLVWHRPRAERLFGFEYRIGIYTPEAKRAHGYYVLPFLLGERLVARVDLKPDRKAGVLHALSAHAEACMPGQTEAALAAELRVLAGWLGLSEIAVRPRGNLGPALSLAVTDGA